MGATPRLSSQDSQLRPPGRLPGARLLECPPYPSDTHRRGFFTRLVNPKDVPRQMSGFICHGGPRWHPNYSVGKLRPARKGPCVFWCLAGARLYAVSGRISGGVHTYPIFLCLSLLPLTTPPPAPFPPRNPPAPPSPRRPVLLLRYSGGIPPPRAAGHAPATRPPPRLRPALLPLAPSYTARALLFAEPVSACRGVACSLRGRVYTRGRGPCSAASSGRSTSGSRPTEATARRILRSR